MPKLLALLALFLIAACGPEAPPRDSGNQSQAAIEPLAQPDARLLLPKAPDPRAMGDPRAPIVVIEYSDYQCPFCATFEREAKPQIDEQYVKAGKVYFVYRDLPLTRIHPGAVLASHAANCAAEQGRFWDMHDRLFAGQVAGEWSDGSKRDAATFGRYAAELGLDVAALEACVAEGRYAAQIVQDMREATELGLTSTPAYVVNGRILLGARPFEGWQAIFDSLLTTP
jgi:protein-disulfide isomerase